MPRELQKLSKRQRQMTPLPFARLLVRAVLEDLATPMVVALWVMRDTEYSKIGKCVDWYDIDRDARTYTGPHPVICHPPCGPWGKLAWRSRESTLDGIAAMRMVHAFGGIVEQPVGSQLFNEYGRGGHIVSVNQGDYGHLAIKPTLLYLVGIRVASIHGH